MDERYRSVIGDAPVTPDPSASAELISYRTNALDQYVEISAGPTTTRLTYDRAGNLLRDILRRAPLVSRVRRIAAERPDDLDSRRAGDDALAALTRQADALRGATAAALRVAAAAQVDPSTLREHTENLHLLREAREESD